MKIQSLVFMGLGGIKTYQSPYDIKSKVINVVQTNSPSHFRDKINS